MTRQIAVTSETAIMLPVLDMVALLTPATNGVAAASLLVASVGGQALGHAIMHFRSKVVSVLLTAASGVAIIAAHLALPGMLNPWFALLAAAFIVFGFVLVAEPIERGPQAFGDITVSAALARMNTVDDNGVVFTIEAAKAPEFTAGMVKLHVEGEIWPAAAKIAG